MAARLVVAVLAAVVLFGCSSTTGGPSTDPADPAGKDPSTCVPTTCSAVSAQCGRITDGCGGTLFCGSCGEGETCGAAGPNQCGVGACTPTTCAAANVACGQLTDGCGAVLECGTCAAGSACTNGQCVCTPKTCVELGKNCGAVDDGCGGTLSCGACGAGQTCSNNVCGTTPCTPQTCQGRCGQVPNGCGGTLSCGACPDTTSCASEDMGVTAKFEAHVFTYTTGSTPETLLKTISWTPSETATYVFDQHTTVGPTLRYSIHESCSGAAIATWPGNERGQLQLQGGKTYLIRFTGQDYNTWTEDVWFHASKLEANETSCVDRADSDGDGKVDCADSDCGNDNNCMGPACQATDIRGQMSFTGSSDTHRAWKGDYSYPLRTLRWTAPEAGTWVFSSNRNALQITVGRGCSATPLASDAMWSVYSSVGPVAPKATLAAGQNVVLFIGYMGDHPGYGSTNFDLRIFKDDGVESSCTDGFNDDADDYADCSDPDCGPATCQ